MSTTAQRYVSAVLDDGAADLTVWHRLMLRELADYADQDGTAWPSVATLARRLGCHPGQVRKLRAHLVAAGYIAVDLSTGGRSSNRYRFPVQAFVSSSTPRAHRRGVTGDDPAPTGAGYPRPPARYPAPTGATIHKEPSIEPRVDETPAAFTDADTARVWLGERRA